MCSTLLFSGVRDDNGARDAVVKRYLKDADSIWIVSHIGRAINDKTAKVRFLHCSQYTRAAHSEFSMR